MYQITNQINNNSNNGVGKILSCPNIDEIDWFSLYPEFDSPLLLNMIFEQM